MGDILLRSGFYSVEEGNILLEIEPSMRRQLVLSMGMFCDREFRPSDYPSEWFLW